MLIRGFMLTRRTFVLAITLLRVLRLPLSLLLLLSFPYLVSLLTLPSRLVTPRRLYLFTAAQPQPARGSLLARLFHSVLSLNPV